MHKHVQRQITKRNPSLNVHKKPRIAKKAPTTPPRAGTAPTGAAALDEDDEELLELIVEEAEAPVAVLSLVPAVVPVVEPVAVPLRTLEILDSSLASCALAWLLSTLY